MLLKNKEELDPEIDILKYEIKYKNKEIYDFKKNGLLKSSLEHLKNLVYNLVQFLMDKIYRNKDKEKYMRFAKELYEHGALDKEDFGLIAGPNKFDNSKDYCTIEKDYIEY